MKCLFIIIAIYTGRAWSQSCNAKPVFGQYLGCIKDRLDNSYESLEVELQEHQRQSVSSCFASSIGAATTQGRCVMALQDLEHEAWSKHGPLRDCSICRTMANAAIKAVLRTSQEEQACFREEISRAVKRESEFCLSGKLREAFTGIPDIPDLEKMSFHFQQIIIKSISDYILIKSRVEFCKERKPDRGLATEQCLTNPFPGYLNKHCQVIESCDLGIPGQCAEIFDQTRSATCSCIDEARYQLKDRIGSIADVIRQTIQDVGGPSIGAASTADRCVNNIKAQLVTPSNDWLEVLNGAMTRCLRNRPSKSLTIESMLRVGCRKVISEVKSRGSATSEVQLRTGFDFINNLIDAFVNRAMRFCPGPHCN